MQYFVYIMTNKPRGTLYVGVTNNLIRRVHERKTGFIDGFTKKYNIKNLCYFEIHDYVYNALQQEKNIKHWKREWKINVIETLNPQWKDLWETICE